MLNHPSVRRTSWAVRSLCLLMSGLTACSTVRPSAAGRDVGKPAGTSANEIVDSWGTKHEPSANPQIAPGNLLNLRCPEDPKINGDFRVEFNGDLKLPYDMTVNTSGYTLSDLKARLVSVYRPYFKTAYIIDLRMKEQLYMIDVRGLVAKPGRYLVGPDASLDTVIGLAEGLSKEATPLFVRIQKGSKSLIFDLNRYYNRGEDNGQIQGWLGGDVLFFQRESPIVLASGTAPSASRQQISVLGEVRKPGEYSLAPDADFVDLIVQAGGFTEKADVDHIEVLHQLDGKRAVTTLSWSKMQEGLSPRNGDVVMVRADRMSAFERHITLTSAILASIASVVTATILVLSYNKGRF